MGVNWKEIKSILQNFNAFYWNSEMVNNISLINVYAFQQTFMRQHTAEFYINCYVPMVKKNISF